MNEQELYHAVRSLPLDEDALIWIAGAHEGEQVRMMLDNYPSRIWAFEPQPGAYARMLDSMSTPDHMRLSAFNFGLGPTTMMSTMSRVGTMGATYMLVPEPSPILETQLVDIVNFMNKRDYPVWVVDLFLMNIEGFEFILLPHMIDTGIIKRFKRLLVQFHAEFGNPTLYQSIRSEMEHTHRLLWEYGNGLWVMWERNGL